MTTSNSANQKPNRHKSDNNQLLRSFVFTLNNPETCEILWPEHVRYAVWQLEAAKTGTKHLQGYVEFTKPVRFMSVKRLIPKAHIEKRYGTREQARDYCMKADTRVDGPWEHGDWKSGGSGRRNDIRAVLKAIESGATVRDLIKLYPETWVRHHQAFEKAILSYRKPKRHRTELIALVGDPGSGKTFRAFKIAPDAFVKPSGPWFDGYDGLQDIIIDEIDKNGIEPCVFLMMTNRHPLLLPVKGGFVNFLGKRIIATSNKQPRDWFPDVDPKAIERRIDSKTDFRKLDDGRVEESTTIYEVDITRIVTTKWEGHLRVKSRETIVRNLSDSVPEQKC